MKQLGLNKWFCILIWVAGLFVAGPGCADCATAGSVSPLVYVANGDSHAVSVIRSSDDRVVSTVDVGGVPLSLAVMPGGEKLYTGVFGRGITVIGTAAYTITKTIATSPLVEDCPETQAVTRDGSKLYVVDSQTVGGQWGTVSAIQTRDDAVTAALTIELICSE